MTSNATYQTRKKFRLGWMGGQHDLYFDFIHKIPIALKPLRGFM